MLLDELSPEERDNVEKAGCRRQLRQGDEIIREGESGRSLYVLLAGTAAVRKDLSRDQYKQLRALEPGEFFGGMSFLGVSERSASVVAATDCELLELGQAELEQLAQENPMIGFKIYRSIARDLAGRLKTNTDDLKKALLWVIEGMHV